MAVLKADDRDFQLSRRLGSHESFASEKQKQSDYRSSATRKVRTHLVEFSLKTRLYRDGLTT